MSLNEIKYEIMNHRVMSNKTEQGLKKVRKAVNALFTDETKNSLKLTVTDYAVDQVANLVECVSDEIWPREKLILLEQVKLAKRLSYARNLLSNGDFESPDWSGVNEWRTSSYVKVVADNPNFKGRYLHMPGAITFELDNVYPSYAYQKVDEAKLKPYTRYLVRGFVGNSKNLKLLVQRYGNEVHVEMNVPNDIRYDIPSSICDKGERCRQQSYPLFPTHTCNCKDQSQITTMEQHKSNSCRCKNPHEFSYHIDTGSLDLTENLGLLFVLKIMSPDGEANIDNLEVVEANPLTGPALARVKRREYKWSVEITKKRLQSDTMVQAAQNAVCALFTSSQENELNVNSTFFNILIAADLVQRIPYVYDPFLIGALPGMNFEVVQQLSLLIDRARGLYVRRNLVRNGTFSSYTEGWHVTKGVEVQKVNNTSVLVLSDWSYEASQQLKVTPNHGYVLRVTARKTGTGRGTITISDCAENIEILTFTSCDFDIVGGEIMSNGTLWGFATKTLDFFPDTSQIQINIGETEGRFEIGSVELICMELMDNHLYTEMGEIQYLCPLVHQVHDSCTSYQNNIPTNSTESAQIQVMNCQSPLFNRLSTDGQAYGDYIKRYAPVIYHDVNPAHDVRADLITRFDVDGDWRMDNQWDTIGVYPQVPYVYTSVQETNTHLFLGYYFYHVRDDGPNIWDRHENDLEGMMIAIRKDGGNGIPVAMETISHSDFLRYRLQDPNVTPGYSGIENTTVRFSEETHPEMFITSNGSALSINAHGHDVSAFIGTEPVGSDGIIYKFGETPSGEPTQFSPAWQHIYSYGILPIEEIWDKKFQYNNTPFFSFGAFPNSLGSGHANAPWNWSDKDQDGTLGKGIFFTDPAYLFDIDFNGLGTFSHQYVYNPYWTHKVTIKSVTPTVYKDPNNNLPDIYISVAPFGETRYISEKVWMKDNASLNIAHTVNFGGDQKTANTTFSEPSNTIHIALSDVNPLLWMEVQDYDPSDTDDFMGSIVLPLDTGNIAGKAYVSEAIIDYEVILNPSFPLAPEGVYIYTASNFSGTSKKLTSSVANFKDIGMNDQVSSIKIVGPYEVIGYAAANYTGNSAILTTNDNLGNTPVGNDTMSSIKITRKTT
ncbi:beta/gamma crystallin-related protein [Bacillus toyonensis]|uniref:beta/gamma crystallin-related protein n=1 Tax=Bacillus toyonensis TaxID=155322 RepID=UPI003D1E1F8D